MYWDGERLALASHRIWRPAPDAPLDLEATIEAHLRELHARYRLAAILCDPYQLHRSITTLRSAGLPIQELPQTVGHTTQMGQTLSDVLTGRNLRLYPADDLRRQALNTVAVETGRGFRIAKDKASRKIDAIVALAMACVAALDGRPQPLQFYAVARGWRRLDDDSTTMAEPLSPCWARGRRRSAGRVMRQGWAPERPMPRCIGSKGWISRMLHAP